MKTVRVGKAELYRSTADVPLKKLTMQAAKSSIRDAVREIGVSFSFGELRELLKILTT